jgi:hypothetical protein
VDIHEQSHGWGSQVIEFFAIGTAVIPDEDQRATSFPIQRPSSTWPDPHRPHKQASQPCPVRQPRSFRQCAR